LNHPLVEFENLRGRHYDRRSLLGKLAVVVKYYFVLFKRIFGGDARIVHIQWPYKLQFLERTLFCRLYKLVGKKVIFTAHNVDQDARDGIHSPKNKFALTRFYRAVDHIVVHTARMKADLSARFGVNQNRISVIPHGLMTAVPETKMSRSEARAALGLKDEDQVALFFGMIAPYKGLAFLVESLAELKQRNRDIKLVVGGRIKECADYWEKIARTIEKEQLSSRMVLRLAHIPDHEVEVFFKAADVLVMPYVSIFQSGVLFLGYRFGLPVVATDVGSLREDIVEAETGFIASACEAKAIADALERYFDSDLYKDLANRRRSIKAFATERYSWESIGSKTKELYHQLAKAA
jgi:glycosyltransferase involved in cell wall biosynthesis